MGETLGGDSLSTLDVHSPQERKGNVTFSLGRTCEVLALLVSLVSKHLTES